MNPFGNANSNKTKLSNVNKTKKVWKKVLF